MKISAHFSSVDEAEAAVRAVKEAGIAVKRRNRAPHPDSGLDGNIYFPLYPDGTTEGVDNGYTTNGMTDYNYNRGAIYIAGLDLVERRNIKPRSSDIRMVIEVNESDKRKAADILVNRHGTNLMCY